MAAHRKSLHGRLIHEIIQTGNRIHIEKVSYINPPESIPSIAHEQWEGAELRLQAAVEVLHQRAKEGQSLPRSVGIPASERVCPKFSVLPNKS